MDRTIPIELFRTFLALMRTQSFSQTGDEIGRSQSAVSLQMQRLQEIVGSPVLEHAGKPLVLTPQGEILYEYAKRILALNDECLSRLSGKPADRGDTRRHTERLCAFFSSPHSRPIL